MKAKKIFLRIVIIWCASFCVTACFKLLPEENKEDVHESYADSQVTQRLTNIDAIFYFKKGMGCYHRKQGDSALYFYRKSLKYEVNPITYNEMGIVENERQNFQLAIPYLDKSIHTDNTYWPAYINKSISLYFLKRRDEAQALLEHLEVVCHSKYFVAYSNVYLAAIYAEKGDCSRAKNSLAIMQDLYEDESLHAQLLQMESNVRNFCDTNDSQQEGQQYPEADHR